MINKSAYELINDYCTTKYEGVITQIERDFVLRKFLDSYFETVEKFKEDNGQEPNESEQQTIINSLLNENTLLSYVDSAKNYYDRFKDGVENEIKKKQNKSSFWKSVLGSVLANLIYSIILIIVFYVAKDQISSWLTQIWQ